MNDHENSDANISIGNSTPINSLLASPPGSESQRARVQIIHDGLNEDRSKRPRLHYDAFDSSVSTDFHPGTPGTPMIGATASQAIELDSQPSAAISTLHTVSPIRMESYDNDNTERERHHEVEDNDTYFDFLDNVERCIHCSHEIWDYGESCTNEECTKGALHGRYFEGMDYDDPYPEIFLDEYCDESELQYRQSLADDYLDNQSSAYDTQDETKNHEDFFEEYEVGSFIDDASERSDKSDSDSSHGEDHIEDSIEDLHTQYASLIDRFEMMKKDNRDLRESLRNSHGLCPNFWFLIRGTSESIQPTYLVELNLSISIQISAFIR
jgi:hypothetical protein